MIYTELNHAYHYPLDFINYLKELTAHFNGKEKPEAVTFNVPFKATDSISAVLDNTGKIKFWVRSSELELWIKHLAKVDVNEIAGANLFYLTGTATPNVINTSKYQDTKGLSPLSASRQDGYEAGIKIVYKSNNHAKRVN